jgi:hypothetical protein
MKSYEEWEYLYKILFQECLFNQLSTFQRWRNLSASNFQHQKLEAKWNFFCFGLFGNSWAWSSRASRKAEASFLASIELLCNLKSYKIWNSTKIQSKQT